MSDMISFYRAVWINHETGYINTSQKISLKKEDIQEVKRIYQQSKIIYPLLWEIITKKDTWMSVDESLNEKLK